MHSLSQAFLTMMAPIEGASTGGITWQFTVTTSEYYDLIFANGPTWSTQQTAIYLTPGTYSFNVSSATQVELLENSTVALNGPLTGQWNASTGGTWSVDTNWTGLIVPDGSGASATFQSSPGLTSPGSISLDSNRILGHLTFNSTKSYTIAAGGGVLTIDNSGNMSTGVPSINVIAGSHTIAAPIVLAAGGVTVTTSLGTSLTISGSINGSGGMTTAGTGSLTLSGINSYNGGTNISGGSLILDNAKALPLGTSLTIGAGASVIASNLGSSPALQIGSLNISGTLDLQKTGLDISAGTLPAVSVLLQNGYKGGHWNGSAAIVSSNASADTTHLTALGVLLNDNSSGIPLYGTGGTIATTFEGTTPADGDVLVKYTYYGDANLDGKVDGSDYSRIDNGCLTSATGWSDGDFNYDGVINGSDYTLIDNAFNSQGSQLTAEIADLTAVATSQIVLPPTAVPEPASLVIIPLAATAVLGRRRRRFPSRQTEWQTESQPKM